MKKEPVQISIIIPCKDAEHQIASCLSSLLQQKTSISYEIIIIDNNSNDNSYRNLQSLAKKNEKIIISKEQKSGSPAARNHGAQLARGNILAFTDVDCEFEENWIHRIVQPLLSNKTHAPIGATHGQTISKLPIDRKMNLWERYLDNLFFEFDKQRFNAYFLPWGPTCNLAVRKDVFFAVGMFDENFTSAAYDIDLCWRLLYSGWALQHTSDAVVYHERRSSLLALLRQWENYFACNFSMFREYRKQKENPWKIEPCHPIKDFFRLSYEMFRGLRYIEHKSPLNIFIKLSFFLGISRCIYSNLKPQNSLAASRMGQLDIVEKLLPNQYKNIYKQWWWWIDPNSSIKEPILLRKNRTTMELSAMPADLC